MGSFRVMGLDYYHVYLFVIVTVLFEHSCKIFHLPCLEESAVIQAVTYLTV